MCVCVCVRACVYIQLFSKRLWRCSNKVRNFSAMPFVFLLGRNRTCKCMHKTFTCIYSNDNWSNRLNSATWICMCVGMEYCVKQKNKLVLIHWIGVCVCVCLESFVFLRRPVVWLVIELVCVCVNSFVHQPGHRNLLHYCMRLIKAIVDYYPSKIQLVRILWMKP